MTSLEVFAPASCALPHEVAVSGDEAACRLTVDLQWLAEHGVQVARATLSDEPGRFVEHDAVRFLMTILGADVLPVILVDGLIRSHGRYPDRAELASWAGVDAAADGVAVLVEQLHVEAADEAATAEHLVDDDAPTAIGAPAYDLRPGPAVRRRSGRGTARTASRSRTPNGAQRRASGAA